MDRHIYYETVQNKEGKFCTRMKTNLLKTFLAVVMIIAMTPVANAYDFSQDGLYYTILSEDERTVEVSRLSNNSVDNNYIEGDLVIPDKIAHNSTTYTVTAIGTSAFWRCSGLTSVTIPNSVTEIGLSAFEGCSSLTSVTIPNSVTTIGRYAFSGCSSLTEINVDVENPNFTSEDGIVYSKDKTSLLVCPGGKKEVIIPNFVTKIGDCAFSNCSSLTSVTIPNSVTTIGFQAFSFCFELTSVTIPSSVTEIGDMAFSGCFGLTSVTIPSSVTEMSGSVFSGCGGLTGINVDVENQNFTSENGIVFSKDKTSLLMCPAGKKGEVSIPNSVTEICNGAFSGCSDLTSVTIPNSVTSIGDDAFSGCSDLTSITIPSSVTEIGSSAFYYCDGLSSVTIPNSVTTIGESAFSGCRSLKSIYCQWIDPIECYPRFPEDVLNSAVLYVPTGCKGAYEKVDPWRNFLNIKETEYMAGAKDVADRGIEVKVVDGSIVADRCAEMEVYSMSGQLVYRGTGRAENLAPGVYVVRAGGKTVKVMVAR